MLNARGTSGAALYAALPAWVAVIVHEPVPGICTVSASAIEQLPLAPKLTTSPDDAVAETSKSGSPKALFERAAKSIVWSAGSTVRAAVADDAARCESPAHEAPTPAGYEPTAIVPRLAL